MLVRVTTDPLNELYLNTDAIRSVEFTKQDRSKPDRVYCYSNVTHCYVDLEGHNPASPLEITEDAGRFLLITMDANDSLLDNAPAPAPAAYFGGRVEPLGPCPPELIARASLPSKIAQCLRDTWQAVTLPQLAYMFQTTEALTLEAIEQLKTEGVVLEVSDEDPIRYYHASQRAAFAPPAVVDCPECKGTGKLTFNGIIEGEEKPIETPCYFCEGTGKMIPAPEVPAPVVVTQHAPADLIAIHATNCQQCTAALSPNEPELELCGTGKFIAEGLAEAKAKRNPDPLTAGEALPDA